MNDDSVPPPRHIPARDIPTPLHLSPQARATFAPRPFEPRPSPPPEEKEAWRKHVANSNAMLLPLVEASSAGVSAEVEDLTIGQATVYAITPAGVAPDDRRVYLDIHGGALVFGAGAFTRASGISTAGVIGRRVWAVDYRMPPDHPYPAGLDDCVAAYRALLGSHRSQDIVIGGASAGGNLAAATILRARDEGLPLPAGAVLLTPEVDLTESGDSFQTNLGLDTTLIGSLMSANLLYADGHDLAHPYLSPLFGDLIKGFPPTFLATGTRDLFLSNTVRMHAALRAADVDADLYIMEAASHGGFPRSPEAAAKDRELVRFLDSVCPR
jgi:epsilon-lactone hydrolase